MTILQKLGIQEKCRTLVAGQLCCMEHWYTQLTPARLSLAMVELRLFTSKQRQKLRDKNGSLRLNSPRLKPYRQWNQVRCFFHVHTFFFSLFQSDWLQIQKTDFVSISWIAEDEEDDYQEHANQKGEGHTSSTAKDLSDKLETLHKWNDILTKRYTVLQRVLNELETIDAPGPDVAPRIKTVNEKAAEFKIAALAMSKVYFKKFIKLSWSSGS